MNKVRIGIIGTGAIARDHARGIAMLPDLAEVVAAADLSPERLDDFARSFGVRRCHPAVAALLDDPEIDLVTITTPPHAHEELAIAALERGKYVLCEKPLAASVASARRIAAAAARHPGRLAVGYQLRYATDQQRALWLCQNGWLGELTSARLERHSYIPQTCAWWGAWPVSGGGVMMTQMIHDLDFLQLALGRPLSADAALDTRYSTIESEDFVEAAIRFENGAIARCIGSVNSGRLTGGVALHGTLGTLTLPWSVTFADPVHGEKARAALDAALASRNGYASLTPHARFYKAIIERVHAGADLPVTAAEGMVSLEMCAAAYESSLAGREIPLPLSQEAASFEGISREAYEARARRAERRYYGIRGMTADGQLRPTPPPPAPVGLKQRARSAAVRSLRWALDVTNVEPAAIKALLRSPAPVHGGPRVRRFPWPRRRHFDAREKRAVERVLDREIRRGGAVIYGGPEEQAYCEAFASFLGGGYADAVNSGTNAIYVALRALELKPGSEVIVAPISDAGGIMPVVMNMCVPVAADSEPGSLMTSAEQMRRVMSDRTSAILVTHIGGYPIDLDPILALAAQHGIPVLEDCAQAHGATYKGRRVGTFGAIAAFSTMFGKHHATGAQGGVIFTRDLMLFSKAKQAADRGKSYDDAGHQANVVASLNFNQDEISMAIGRVQLEKLPRSIEARRAFAKRVQAGIERVEGIRVIGDPSWGESSYLYLLFRLDPSKLRCDSLGFAQALTNEGIEGAHPGLSIYPTEQSWNRNRATFGEGGPPWSLHGGAVEATGLPNAHEANRLTVRLEIHEGLGGAEARDLSAAIAKLAHYFRR